MKYVSMEQAFLRNEPEAWKRTCVACGEVFYHPKFRKCRKCRYTPPKERFKNKKLSPREWQIIERLPKQNKEIAQELLLSLGTVKEYVYHIFHKLGLTNRCELLLWRENRKREKEHESNGHNEG